MNDCRLIAPHVDYEPTHRSFVDEHSTFWLVDANDEIVGVSNLRHRLTDSLLRFGGHIGFGVRPSARRRGYATELLRATLVEARGRGLRRVRVTRDQRN